VGQSEFTLSLWERGRGGRWRTFGRGGPRKSHKTHNIQYGIKNTEYTCSKTHIHKITNVPVFYMALGRNDFDRGKSMDFPPSKSLFPGPYKQYIHY
jgi:hypothetical protein